MMQYDNTKMNVQAGVITSFTPWSFSFSMYIGKNRSFGTPWSFRVA
jgi:hypothetical protein